MQAVQFVERMPDYQAETLLQAWGHYRRAEVCDIVGLPASSPSFKDYRAPDWYPPPQPSCSQSDIDRACWAMIVLLSRYRRLYRDLSRHYVDGQLMPYGKMCVGRSTFAAIWLEWSIDIADN